MACWRTPLVIWPAPGYPAFVTPPGTDLELIVGDAKEGAADLRQWAQRLYLREVGGTRAVPVAVEQIEPLPSASTDMRTRGLAPLMCGTTSLVRIRLRVNAAAPPPAPRTVTLYDLMSDGALVRARSVAVWTADSHRLTLAFVSDLHLSELWDRVASAVDRYAPELASRLLHPRRLLHRFIEEANALWAEGHLDLVVFGGDLVDHVYIGPPEAVAAGRRGTNVDGFLEAIGPLRVPMLVTVGNHDYRAFPWRPRVYGLSRVGIPRPQCKRLLQAAGLWSRWPLRLSDRCALWTEDASGSSALAHHLAKIAPATDYCLTLRGLRLLFASTGRDILPRWRTVEPARRRLLWRNLRTSWANPDSEGLYDSQVDQIESWLHGSRGAAVFLHAPILHAADGSRVEDRVATLMPGDQDYPPAREAYERRLLARGVRQGVLFRNPGRLLQVLASAEGQVLTFSGHVHRASAVEIDRNTFAAHSLEPERAVASAGAVTLLTAPALGQLYHGGEGAPGYFLARFDRGELISLRRVCGKSSCRAGLAEA